MFELKLNNILQVELFQSPHTKLGLKIRIFQSDDNMSIFLSQKSLVEELTQTARLSEISATTKLTPYRSSYPVDKIRSDVNLLSPCVRAKLKDTYRSLVGSLN